MTGREDQNADKLRHEIDSGETGDKVAFSDPAAAPLGTDDEAAGTTPTPEQVATARANETTRGPGGADRAPNNRTIPQRQGGIPTAPIWMIGGAVVVILLLVFLID